MSLARRLRRRRLLADRPYCPLCRVNARLKPGEYKARPMSLRRRRWHCRSCGHELPLVRPVDKTPAQD